MDLGLARRRIAVLGGTSGIGLATARLLLDKSAHVVVSGRNHVCVGDVVAALAAEHPGRIDAVLGDARDDTAAIVRKAAERWEAT